MARVGSVPRSNRCTVSCCGWCLRRRSSHGGRSSCWATGCRRRRSTCWSVSKRRTRATGGVIWRRRTWGSRRCGSCAGWRRIWGHLNGRCYEYAARALDQERGGPGRPRGYISFEVHAPKRRLISAAPFRDRMVHHALHAVDRAAVRARLHRAQLRQPRGEGQHRAMVRYERLRARHRYVLRRRLPLLPAIDHEILKTDLRRRIRCRRTLAVLDRIVDRSNPREAGASALSERRPIPYGATGARPPRCACNR